MTCSNKISKINKKECSCMNLDNQIKEMQIFGDLVYIDGLIYGNLISIKGNTIKVEIDNGNKYMKGQIVDILVNMNIK
jgi:hypothetical protein